MKKQTGKTNRRFISMVLILFMLIASIPTDALAQANGSQADDTNQSEDSVSAEETDQPEDSVQQESEAETETADLPEITVSPAEEPVEEAASIEAQPEETSEAEGTETGSISGTLWVDNNTDGTMSVDEALLSTYTVYLYSADNLDEAINSTTTDMNGFYQFVDLTPGTYTVGVKAQNFENAEYLIPLEMTKQQNKFYHWQEFSDGSFAAVTDRMDIEEGSSINGIDASMRSQPQIQALAATNKTMNYGFHAKIVNSSGQPMASLPVKLMVFRMGARYHLVGFGSSITKNTDSSGNVSLTGLTAALWLNEDNGAPSYYNVYLIRVSEVRD